MDSSAHLYEILPDGRHPSSQTDTPALQARTAMSPCVVVIEDDLDVLQLLRDVLGSSGFSFVGLSDPKQIHGMAPSVRPAAFLVDLMLPGKSGIELAQELRDAGYGDTPMIAISSSRLMLRTAAKSALFRATLAKPFDVTEVVDTLEHCIL
jgi:CheY-like chemotaxis protein